MLSNVEVYLPVTRLAVTYHIDLSGGDTGYTPLEFGLEGPLSSIYMIRYSDSYNLRLNKIPCSSK